MPFCLTVALTQEGSRIGTGVILTFIIACIIIGIIRVVRAFVDLGREKAGLNEEIIERCRNVRKIEMAHLREILDAFEKPKKPKRKPAVYKRVRIIYDMLKARKNGRQVQTLQMKDLHQLSEQTILSRRAPTGLRIITAILLIFGICGTLWGVHSAIPHGGATSIRIKDFATALDPSRFAVISTIFFLIMRGIYAAMLDSFLRLLDRETMIRFFPLIPSNDSDREIARFSQKVEDFSGSVEVSIKPAKKEADKTLKMLSRISEDKKMLDATSRELAETLQKLEQKHTVHTSPGLRKAG